MNPPKGGSDTLLQLQELIPTVQVPAKKVSSVQGSGIEVYITLRSSGLIQFSPLGVWTLLEGRAIDRVCYLWTVGKIEATKDAESALAKTLDSSFGLCSPYQKD